MAFFVPTIFCRCISALIQVFGEFDPRRGRNSGCGKKEKEGREKKQKEVVKKLSLVY